MADTRTEVRRSRLGLNLAAANDIPPGRVPLQRVQVESPGFKPVTVQCWPAPQGADSQTLADRMGQRYARSDAGYQELSLGPAAALGVPNGVERRFHASGGHGREERIEKYAVAWGYGWAAAAVPEQGTQLGTLHIVLPSLDGAAYFAPALAIECGADSTTVETVQATVSGTFQRMAATLTTMPSPPAPPQWLERKVRDIMAAHPGAVVVSQRDGPVIDQIEGTVMRIRVPGQTSMIVAIGACQIGPALYDATIWVAEHERRSLPSLAYRPVLQPTHPM